ncbi:triabin-like isoform X2 [Rhodnius prolixus]|uniref:triabin-like isoform X2 n=1 Tax=Rhodnius prolixus TaxID=13249 RepID=UPI003D188176
MRIILVSFFGILGCTFCKHVRTGPEGCRDVYDQADPKYKRRDFYTGSWYLTHAKYRNHSTLCTKFDMTFNPLQIKYDANMVKFTCKGKKIKDARHIEFKCKGVGGEKTDYPDYESIVSVIRTDYTGFATVYTCKKTGGHEDNVFVLSRTQDGKTPKAAKNSLKKLGEKFEKFVKVPCIQLQVIKV